VSRHRNRIPRNLPRGEYAKQPSFQKFSVFIFGTAGLTTLSVLVVGVFVYTATLAGPALRSTQLAAVISADLVDLTNQDRVSNELNGLTVSPLLEEAAQAKANDMAKNGYFAHVSPAGLNSWYWFKQAGYNFSYAGENLAVDFTDSGAVNQAWLNSPTHRANILDSHFTQIGIATAQGMFEGHQTTFVVQMFGTPADYTDGILSVQTITSPAVATEIAIATTKPTSAPLASEVLGTSSQELPVMPVVHQPVLIPQAHRSLSLVVASTTHPATTSSTQVMADASAAVPHYAPVWAVFVAAPEGLLRTVYSILAVLLLIALVVRTGFEIKRHHIKHVYATIALFILMAVLFYAADYFVFVQPVLGSASQVTGQ
jgi:uncharacterized protein YkwD